MFQQLWFLVVLIALGPICTPYIPMDQQIRCHMLQWAPALLLQCQFLSRNTKEALTREEGIKLVEEAISAGIFNDHGSASNVDVCVITKGHKEYLRNYLLPNPRTYVCAKGYSFSKKTEVLLIKISPIKEKVEVIEGGDAMEE